MLNGRINRRRLMAASSASLVSAAFLAACGSDGGGGDSSGLVSKSTDATKDAKKGGTLGFFINADPPNFDPNFSRVASIRTINQPVYQRLLKWKVGPKDNLPEDFEGDAAESFELTPDGLTATFKLRQNNKWDPRPPTNGRVLTSEDVKFAWEAYASGNNSTRLDMAKSASEAAPVERMEYPDKNTVVARMAFPDASILTKFAYTWNFSIIPTEASGGANGFDPKLDSRGSGPFMRAKAQSNISYEYERNPNYWNASSRPFLDAFSLAVIPDSSQVLAQLRAGRIWYYEPAADQVLLLKQDVPKLVMQAIPPFNTKLGGYHVNPSKLPTSQFKDVRIRHAMSMLINRDAYDETFGDMKNFEAQGITMEHGWDTHVPVGWEGDWLDPKGTKLGDAAKYWKFNPEEAVRLLRAANAYGLEFDYSYIGQGGVSTDQYRKQNEVIVAMLAKDGAMKPKPNLIEAATYSRSHNNAQGQFDGTAYNPTSGPVDIVSYISSEFSTGGSHNYGFSEEYYGKALAISKSIRREFDPEKRRALIHDWQKAMGENMPTIPVQSDNQWTSFTLNWPKLRNYGGIGVNANDAIYNTLYENYWYDKSQDQP